MTSSMLRTLAPGLIATLLWTSCNKQAATQQSDSKEQPLPAKRPTNARQVNLRTERTSEFGARIRDMSIAEIQELWTDIDGSELSLEEKRGRQCQIIERLTKSGNFDEAMKFVSRYGEGLHRQALVFSLFAKSPEPLNALVDRMQSDTFSSGDRNVLLRALARNIGSPGGYAKVAELLARKPDLNGVEANAIGSGLAAAIDLGQMGLQFYDDPEIPGAKLSPTQLQGNYTAAEHALLGAMKACPDLKSELLNSFLVQAGDSAPFQCWNSLLEHHGDIAKDLRTQRLHDLTRSMFGENPQSALEALKNLNATESSVPFFKSGGAEWARTDIGAVESWFTGESNDLAKPEADSLAQGVAGFLAHDDRPAEGWKWVNRIGDPEQRRRAEGQVWSQEKRMVEAEASINPKEVVEKIVSGTSEHADYWIETALNEWIEQDDVAAGKWYDEHASSLTPKQTEAVSLTYARAALKDGDVEMARKWAAQVITPKMKTKIETEIAKAAGN